MELNLKLYSFRNSAKHVNYCPLTRKLFTLCLGKSDNKNNWGIYVEGKEFILEEGQGVIYKGCEQEHWRNDLEYDWHTQVFLHYIEKGGKFDPEFRYDGRPFLYGDPVN